MFCGKRLKIAREFRGWTQTKLAEQVAASCALISLCETGQKKDPARDLVEACGSVLGLAPEFFDSDNDVFHEDEGNFASTDYPGENEGASSCSWDPDRSSSAEVSWGVLPTPKYSLDNGVSLRGNRDGGRAMPRALEKLGIDTPLLRIGEVLEDAGVVIVRHVVKSTKVDTFSYSGGGMTMILPNQEIESGPRWNFRLGTRTWTSRHASQNFDGDGRDRTSGEQVCQRLPDTTQSF